MSGSLDPEYGMCATITKARNIAKTALVLLALTYAVSSFAYAGIGANERHLGGMDYVTGAHYFLKYKTTNFTVSSGTYGVNFHETPANEFYRVNVTYRNFGMLLMLGFIYFAGFVAVQTRGDAVKAIHVNGKTDSDATEKKRKDNKVWHFGAITSAVLCVAQILSWSFIQEHIQYLAGSEDAALPAYIVGVVTAFAVTSYALDTDRILKRTFGGGLTEDATYMSIVGAIVNTGFFGILFVSVLQPLALSQSNGTAGTMPVATQAMVGVHLTNLVVSWIIALVNLAGAAGWGNFEIPHDQFAAFDHAMLLVNVFVFVFGSIGIYAGVGEMVVA